MVSMIVHTCGGCGQGFVDDPNTPTEKRGRCPRCSPDRRREIDEHVARIPHFGVVPLSPTMVCECGAPGDFYGYCTARCRRGLGGLGSMRGLRTDA